MGEFRKFIEAVAINPHFLWPGETLDSAHKDLDELMNKPEPTEKSRKRKAEETTIYCYRGIGSALMERDKVSENSSSITLSPYKTPERMLWFTNSLQSRGIELSEAPIEYAQHYATKDGPGYLIVYPLKCTKHYEEIVYMNGQKSTSYPRDLMPFIETTGKSQFRAYHGAVYELPRGWIFTWQNEKFIGCEVDVKVPRRLIKKID